MLKVFPYFITFFLFVFFFSNTALSSRRINRIIPEAQIKRTHRTPDIDGILEPRVWAKANVVNNFSEYLPDHGTHPSQYTEVRLLYDDKYIYIGAILYDSAPDSILKQLGQRDSNLNADLFGIRFDTYNNQLDAYTFEVSASGVQRDYRFQDRTYDGVWESSVKLHEDGWTVEIRIPYSAIRFPASDCQNWGMQIYRGIRRHREFAHWALEDRDSGNRLLYWGELSGICQVEAPLRLSLTPYLTVSGEHFPHNAEGVSNLSGSFSGGMDLKYGINESFTLDMTLLPDFSQVPSDNQVKNLSAFEVVYGEQRPFFSESIDLFTRGGLFYSRRVGGRPAEYGSVESKLSDDEVLVSNPNQANLVNAFKLSGRTVNGLGIGLFNAVTSKTHATVENMQGEKRKILTDPATNFNILVFDQALPNNSSVYIINTNVLRGAEYGHANVTGAGTTLANADNSYEVKVSGAFSQLYEKNDSLSNQFQVDVGSRYNLSFEKTRGNFRYEIERRALDPNFDDNDLGITHRNNQITDIVSFRYHFFDPVWKMRNWNNRLVFRNQSRYNDYQIENVFLQYSTSGTTLKYLFLQNAFYLFPKERVDYFEPRKEGRFFVEPVAFGGWFGLSSDYRKPLALDMRVNYQRTPDFNKTYLAYNLSPRYRYNDQLSFRTSFEISTNENSIGYAFTEEDDIVFGSRDVTTVENVVSSDYVFSSDMYLTFRLRQYWSKGEYNNYFLLQNDGYVDIGQHIDVQENKDFNFNSFNIDLVFTWLFAPGSSLNLVWKNAVLHEKTGAVDNYFDNFDLLINSPQYNSLSLKLLYYLDYQQLKGA